MDGNRVRMLGAAWKKYTEHLENLKLEYEDICKENIRLGEVVEALTGQVLHLENLIKKVYATFAWRFAEKLRRIRNKIMRR